MKKTGLILAFAACILLSLTGCDARATKSITVAGSTTVMPIAEAAAERFTEDTGCHVLVSGLGSSAGIEAVLNGTAEIATSSRDLTPTEAEKGDFDVTVIASDGIAVIVNPDNPVKNLSTDELRAIYSGEIVNWQALGGEDLPILLVNRDEASGTREAFKTIVMKDTPFDRHATVLPGTGQVRDVVSRTKGAIGYISIGFVESKFSPNKVHAVSVDGVLPTEQNVSDGKYPISRNLYFFTIGEKSPETQAYIDFVLSPAMYDTICDAGYLPVSPAADPYASPPFASEYDETLRDVQLEGVSE